jgi:hypothetical protein
VRRLLDREDPELLAALVEIQGTVKATADTSAPAHEAVVRAHAYPLTPCRSQRLFPTPFLAVEKRSRPLLGLACPRPLPRLLRYHPHTGHGVNTGPDHGSMRSSPCVCSRHTLQAPKPMR